MDFLISSVRRLGKTCLPNSGTPMDSFSIFTGENNASLSLDRRDSRTLLEGNAFSSSITFDETGRFLRTSPAYV